MASLRVGGAKPLEKPSISAGPSASRGSDRKRTIPVREDLLILEVRIGGRQRSGACPLREAEAYPRGDSREGIPLRKGVRGSVHVLQAMTLDQVRWRGRDPMTERGQRRRFEK